ncbi:phosphopantetheine-binding protein [Streptomyces sp. NPDC058471]|uniref:phosphopantetheine-binding protein n=1 Tax=Streptomyces sp. NPDC058471 TaxID=3346516 RepID=UPI003664F146
MPSEQQITLTAPPAPFADVLAGVVDMLADVLRLRPEKIDPAQRFWTFGVDSLISVEYMAAVNAHYGTSIDADTLTEHPTPLAFAQFVAGEGAREPHSDPATAELPAPAATSAPGVPSVIAQAPLPDPAPTGQEPPVLDVLREEIARILGADPWEIGTTVTFPALGVGSVLATEFIRVVNHVYGLHEQAASLYEHQNLAALADHITSLLPAGGTPPAVAQEAEPALGAMPLEDLLDAVRVGRVTVGQALAVLPRQG